MNINIKTTKLNNRAFVAIGLTAIVSWIFAFFATSIFKEYAFGLFIWLPLILGASSTLIYGYNNTYTKRKLFSISMWTLLIFCLGLLTFAWEGIICLAMAFPIGLFFTWVGHWLGYQILKSKMGNSSATIILLFLTVPSLMAFENINKRAEKIRSVITSIEINASPETVWKNVVEFPQLK